jgi:hypothetical protein
MVEVSVYADAAAYAAKAEPLAIRRQLISGAAYTALLAAELAITEPAVINRFYPGGTRVPD